MREEWPYVAITTCPSDCLLDTSDQRGRDGGEVKAGAGAGCCRRLRNSSSDQCRTGDEDVCQLHCEGEYVKMLQKFRLY